MASRIGSRMIWSYGDGGTPVGNPRIFPLIEVSRGELEELAGGVASRVEPVQGGFTNTLHRVTLAGGGSVVVKHYAGGPDAFAFEVATLRRLAGILPVPEVVRVEPARQAIVYRWIDGITLEACRRDKSPSAFASLAGPLGRLCAWVARSEPLDPEERWDIGEELAQARAQLASERVRERMGGPLADAVTRAFDTYADRVAWGQPCLAHHDLGGRNILVQHADAERWRIGGVIDWESAGTGTPLVDIGSLFRIAPSYDEAFVTEFERGYREADGELPEDWYRLARLVDALGMIDTLDEEREMPGVFADCRMLLTKLVKDLAAGR
jgi:aminoglycoside phosphotransferase (APT) family kinase protein